MLKQRWLRQLIISSILVASSASAAPYYNIAADVWMEGEEVCLLCTPNNGYSKPPIKNGYYFDKRYQVWRNRYGICQACVPANGFAIPPKDLPDGNTDNAEEKASAAVVGAPVSTGRQISQGAIMPDASVASDAGRFHDCEKLASRVIKDLVRDSGRVFLEDTSASEKPTSESYNGLQFTTVLSGIGQFQIPNGWLRFAYSCYFEQERAAVFDWKRLKVMSWTE